MKIGTSNIHNAIVVNVQLVGGLPSGYMRSLMGFIYGERGNLLLGDTGSEWRAP